MTAKETEVAMAILTMVGLVSFSLLIRDRTAHLNVLEDPGIVLMSSQEVRESVSYWESVFLQKTWLGRGTLRPVIVVESV